MDEMRGLITTLNKQRAMYVPVSAPIVYVKRQEFKSAMLGELTSKDSDYEPLKALLESSMDEGYARLVRPWQHQSSRPSEGKRAAGRCRNPPHAREEATSASASSAPPSSSSPAAPSPRKRAARSTVSRRPTSP